MANPAKEARDKAQTEWPGATVVERTRNHIKHQHPSDPDRFMIDSHIGPIHYGPGEDQEIDTAWEVAVAPWDYEMAKAGYNAFALSDFSFGQIIKYIEPISGESVGFQPQQLQYTNDLDQIQAIADPQSVVATVTDDTLNWTGAYGPDIDLRWIAGLASLTKFLTIQNATALSTPAQHILDGGNPVLRFQVILQKSNGLDIYVNDVLWNEKPSNPVETSGHVEFRSKTTGEPLFVFALPISESEDEDTDVMVGTFRLRKTGPNLFVEHRVPLGWLQSVQEYPIEIDITIDEEVEAGADDARELDNGTNFTYLGIYVKLTASEAASARYNAGFRFQAVEVPNGATIDVAYFEGKVYNSTYDDISVEIYAEAVDDAVDFVDNSDVTSRVTTTASVSWIQPSAGSGWETSPSIVTVIKEIVDRGGWVTGQDLCILMHGHDVPTQLLRIRSQENNNPGKLHIEYSEGGVAYTLECDGGSYAVSGAETDLLKDSLVSAGAGSYALIGAAANLEFGRKLAAGSGSYALSGTAVGLLKTWILPAGVGSYAISGTVVDLLKTWLLSLDAGSYAITGKVASLEYGRKLAAAAGSYAISGAVIDLLKTWILVSDAGSYAIAGKTASLEHGRKLSCASGVYAIAGNAVDLLKTWILTSATGSYAISGTAASLLVGRILSAASGAYVITGKDADLIYTVLGAYILSAEAGSYAITGTTVDLLKTWVLPADAGSCAISGTAANLEYGRRLAAAAGAYAISGSVVDLLKTRVLAAATGSYAISGTAADLLIGRLLSAVAGSYTVTGMDADLICKALVAYILSAEAGSYALTGKSASLLSARRLSALAGSYVITGKDADLVWWALIEAIVRLILQPRSTTLALEPRSTELILEERSTSLTLEDR